MNKNSQSNGIAERENKTKNHSSSRPLHFLFNPFVHVTEVFAAFANAVLSTESSSEKRNYNVKR
jgi:hypothetical protein